MAWQDGRRDHPSRLRIACRFTAHGGDPPLALNLDHAEKKISVVALERDKTCAIAIATGLVVQRGRYLRRGVGLLASNEGGRCGDVSNGMTWGHDQAALVKMEEGLGRHPDAYPTQTQALLIEIFNIGEITVLRRTGLSRTCRCRPVHGEGDRCPVFQYGWPSVGRPFDGQQVGFPSDIVEGRSVGTGGQKDRPPVS